MNWIAEGQGRESLGPAVQRAVWGALMNGSPSQGSDSRRNRQSHHAGHGSAGVLILRAAFRWPLEPLPVMADDGGPRGPVIHSSRFVLVDRQMRIRGTYESDNPEALQRLRRDVKSLVRER